MERRLHLTVEDLWAAPWIRHIIHRPARV